MNYNSFVLRIELQFMVFDNTLTSIDKEKGRKANKINNVVFITLATRYYEWLMKCTLIILVNHLNYNTVLSIME